MTKLAFGDDSGDGSGVEGEDGSYDQFDEQFLEAYDVDELFMGPQRYSPPRAPPDIANLTAAATIDDRVPVSAIEPAVSSEGDASGEVDRSGTGGDVNDGPVDDGAVETEKQVAGPLVTAMVVDSPPLLPAIGSMQHHAASAWEVPSSPESESKEEVAAPSPVACSNEKELPTVGYSLPGGWDPESSSEALGSQVDSQRLGETVCAQERMGAVPNAPIQSGIDPPVPVPELKDIVPRGSLDTQVWMKPLIQLTEDIRRVGGRSSREFRTVMATWSAGTFAGAMVMAGLPMQVLGTSERRQTNVDFCKRMFDQKVLSCFATPEELLCGHGFDRLQGTHVQNVELRGSDCSIIHLPPYVQSKGATASSATPAGDSAGCKYFECLCEAWFVHLQRDKPQTFLAGADHAFRTARTSSGSVALMDWVSKCRSYGYAVIFFSVPHSLFLEKCSKTSTIVIGFSTACGGASAAQWYLASIETVLRPLQASQPLYRIWKRPVCEKTKAIDGILEPEVDGSDDDTSPMSAAPRMIIFKGCRTCKGGNTFCKILEVWLDLVSHGLKRWVAEGTADA